MPAGQYNFKIEQGADFTRTIVWYTDDEMTSPKNLSGYTARMKVKTNDLGTTILSSAAGEITITLGGTAGTILISITSAVTTALTATKPNVLAYDLELVSGGGVVTRLLEGHATVKAEVTT
jgi:hypothetical protein